MAQVVKLLVEGVMRYAVELEFEPVSEPWSVMALADGGRVRVRIAVTKLFRLLDEDGNPALNGDGDPFIAVRSATQIASSA